MQVWFVAKNYVLHLVFEITHPIVYVCSIFCLLLHVVDVVLMRDVMYVLLTAKIISVSSPHKFSQISTGIASTGIFLASFPAIEPLSLLTFVDFQISCYDQYVLRSAAPPLSLSHC